MSDRVYLMKTVNGCKDVSIMSPQDAWTVKTDKFILFVYCNFLVFLSTTVCSQNINKQNVYIADETLTDYSFSVGITILNQRIIWKDDIEFVTEFSEIFVWCTITAYFEYFFIQMEYPSAKHA